MYSCVCKQACLLVEKRITLIVIVLSEQAQDHGNLIVHTETSSQSCSLSTTNVRQAKANRSLP